MSIKYYQWGKQMKLIELSKIQMTKVTGGGICNCYKRHPSIMQGVYFTLFSDKSDPDITVHWNLSSMADCVKVCCDNEHAVEWSWSDFNKGAEGKCV
jgi:hypothetical protein